MRIPEVRRKLSLAANDLRAGKRSPELIARHLDILVTELWRRQPRVNAGGLSARRTAMTPELKRSIRDYWRANPKLDQQSIANHFNVNPGRVSEIISGHRR